MASMRDIKRRIKSIKSTQQITKALKMVAAAKLRKAQERVLAARPFAKETNELMRRLVAAASGVSHPLLEVRETKNVGYVLISADRGLCGGYNANILRMAQREMQEVDNPLLITIGRKGREFFRRRGSNIRADYSGLGDEVPFAEAKRIAQALIKFYTEGVYDEVYLFYTEFVSAMTQKPTMIKLLPLEAPAEESSSAQGDYIYEPEPEQLLNNLIPKYVEVMVFRAILEAKASFQGAQMTAMGSATDNAAEMIDKLTLSFNRVRQAAITKEISEVVGGANALD